MQGNNISLKYQSQYCPNDCPRHVGKRATSVVPANTILTQHHVLHDAVSEKVYLRCYIAFHAFDLIAPSIIVIDT